MPCFVVISDLQWLLYYLSYILQINQEKENLPRTSEQSKWPYLKAGRMLEENRQYMWNAWNPSSPFCSVPFPLNLEDVGTSFKMPASVSSCSLFVAEEKVAKRKEVGITKAVGILCRMLKLLKQHCKSTQFLKIWQDLEGLIVKRSPLPLSPHSSRALVKIFWFWVKCSNSI